MKYLRIILILSFVTGVFSGVAQYRDPSKNKAKREKNRQGSLVSFRKKDKERALKAESDPFVSKRKKKGNKSKRAKESDPFRSKGKQRKRKEKKYKNKSKMRKTQKKKDPFKKPKKSQRP